MNIEEREIDLLRRVSPECAKVLADRVKKGANLMDQKSPGWHFMIARDGLRMWSCTQCILGQIYGDYRDGADRIYQETPLIDYDEEARDYGFILREDEQAETAPLADLYDSLGDLWREEINTRLEAAPKQD